MKRNIQDEQRHTTASNNQRHSVLRTFQQFLTALTMLFSIGVNSAWAEEVTATWDFTSSTAACAVASNNQASYASDVNGIVLKTDFSNGGELKPSAGNYAQFNDKAVLIIPVVSTSDVVTVDTWDTDIVKLVTVGGTEYTEGNRAIAHTATDDEVSAGGVRVVATGNGYIRSITVVQHQSGSPAPSGRTFNDFDVNLKTETPVLPVGVTSIGYPQYGGRYDSSHGQVWYAISFETDGPIKITIGGCNYQGGYYGYVTDASDNKLHDFNNNSCSGTDEWSYYGGSASLKLYCGQYCPSIKVEKTEAPVDPTLTVDKTSVNVFNPSYMSSNSVSITLTGSNLTNGTYQVTQPSVDGLTISPTQFTVTDGSVNQTFTISYNSAVAVASATADFTFATSDVDKSVTVTATYGKTVKRDKSPVSVSTETTWDFSGAATQDITLSGSTTPTSSEEFIYTTLGEVKESTAFDALTVKGQYAYYQGTSQVNELKFTTTVPGKVKVTFNAGTTSHTSVLYVNGTATDATSNNYDNVTKEVDVPAGTVVLAGMTGEPAQATQLRFSKVIFTPSAPTVEIPTFSLAEEQTVINTKTPDGWTAVQLPQIPEITEANAAVVSGLVVDADNTTAIQAALDAVPADGGMVIIPEGTWLSGPLTIKSKTVLHLKAGATLKMLPYGTYPAAKANYFIGTGSETVNDVIIEGEDFTSIIDGQGAAWWQLVDEPGYDSDSDPRPAGLVRFRKGTRYLVRNIQFQNSPKPNLVLGESGNASHFTVHDVKIVNPDSETSVATADGFSRNSHNTDGIPVWGPYCNIYKCNISTGDDNVVFDSNSQYCHVWDCDFGRGHGASIGSNTVNVHDILWDNIRFNGTQSGFKIKTDRAKGNELYNITYQNSTMTGVRDILYMDCWYGSKTKPTPGTSDATTIPAGKESPVPAWHDIIYKNITATNCVDKSSDKNGFPIYFYGLPESHIKNVTLDNVTIEGQKGMFMAYVGENDAEGVTFQNGCNITNVKEPTAAAFVQDYSAVHNDDYVTAAEPKSSEKKLLQAKFSNGFDAFIKEDAKTVTAYYLKGETAPTLDVKRQSDKATTSISGNTITVTAEDGTTQGYTLTLSEVEPYATVGERTFDGTETTWLKTGNTFGTGDKANRGWQLARNLKSTESEASSNRNQVGTNRQYYFVGACKEFKLYTASGISSNRNIDVYVNNVKTDITAAPKYADGGTAFITIPCNNAAAMIAIVSNQDGGDAGFAKCELVADDTPVERTFKGFELDFTTGGNAAKLVSEWSTGGSPTVSGFVFANDGTPSVTTENPTVAVRTYYKNTAYGLWLYSAGNDKFTFDVDGPVEITIGQTDQPGSVIVKDAGGNTVIDAFSTQGSTTYTHGSSNVISKQYLGDATTLTVTGAANNLYLPYIKVMPCDKPDVLPEYTVTFYDGNGTSVLGSKLVKMGQSIGEITYSATVPAGSKFRRWKDGDGKEVTSSNLVSANMKVYACVTPIEKVAADMEYNYVLGSKFFADEHEVIESVSGVGDGNGHGWALNASSQIKVKVAGNTTFKLVSCKYPNGADDHPKYLLKNGDTKVDEVAATAADDGVEVLMKYSGEATTLTITADNSCYLHSLRVIGTEVNMDPTWDDTNKYWVVKTSTNADEAVKAKENAKGFTEALSFLNYPANIEGKNKTLYLPNATYDLGKASLTQVPAGVTIKGQSQDGVIIKNNLEKEGISITATLLLAGDNITLENLTVQCRAPWGTGDDTKTAERGVCVEDRGNNNIFRNVTLDGLQDTYYSKKTTSGNTSFFYDCTIMGTVDFICGSGNVSFEKCALKVLPRTNDEGQPVIVAPSSAESEMGYVFNDCTIEDGVRVDADGTRTERSQNNNYYLGRGWQNKPKATFVNTTMKILPAGDGYGSDMNGTTPVWKEVGSKDTSGNAVDTSSRKADTVIPTTDESATPVVAPTVTIVKSKLTWEADAAAIAYYIYKNNVFVTQVKTTAASAAKARAPRSAGEILEYDITGETDAEWTVRGMNELGVLGEMSEVAEVEEPEPEGDGVLYDDSNDGGYEFNLFALKTENTTPSANTIYKVGYDDVMVMTYGNDSGWKFSTEAMGINGTDYTKYAVGTGNPSPSDGTTPTSGCYLTFKPKYNGKLSVDVKVNSGKATYVLKDGVGIPFMAGEVEKANGSKFGDTYYGDITFDVKAGSTYHVYCTGSKMMYYGYKYRVSDYVWDLTKIKENELNNVTWLKPYVDSGGTPGYTMNATLTGQTISSSENSLYYGLSFDGQNEKIHLYYNGNGVFLNGGAGKVNVTGLTPGQQVNVYTNVADGMKATGYSFASEEEDGKYVLTTTVPAGKSSMTLERNGSGRNIYKIEVITPAEKVPTPVAIKTQPSNATTYTGTATILKVETIGFPEPTYQWYECDDDAKTNSREISGATSNKFNYSPSSEGVHYLYVVAKNNVDGVDYTATSDVITVTAENACVLTYSVTPSATGFPYGIVEATKDEKPVTSGQNLSNGDEITFTAYAATGYKFTGWKVNGEDDESTVLVKTITGLLDVVATFAVDEDLQPTDTYKVSPADPYQNRIISSVTGITMQYGACEDWTYGPSTTEVDGVKYPYYSAAKNTNGANNSDLDKEGGYPNVSYWIFRPQYDGTLTLVVDAVANGKIPHLYQNREKYSATLVGTGKSNISWESGKDFSNTKYDGGVRFSVKAGSVYSYSLQGSKGHLDGFTFTPIQQAYKPKMEMTDAGVVTLTNNSHNPDADIYYTTDGSTPTKSSIKYSEPFTASEGSVVKAIAINGGAPESEITVAYSEVSGMITWQWEDGYNNTPEIAPSIIDGLDKEATLSSFGSNLKLINETGKKQNTNAPEGYRNWYVSFTPDVNATEKDDASVIQFPVISKTGIAFKPTHITFRGLRFGTGSGKFDVSIKTDEGEHTVATNVELVGDDTEPYFGTYTYDVDDALASVLASGNSTLCIYLYNLAADEDAGFSNIQISGNLNGAEEEGVFYDVYGYATPEEGGKVTHTPSTSSVLKGKTVTFTATPFTGYKFEHWTVYEDETVIGTEPEYTISSINKDVRLEAHFSMLPLVTFSNNNPSAKGTVPSPVYANAADNKVYIPHNYTLYLQGFTLMGWKDSHGNVYELDTVYVFNSDATLTPVFERNEVALTDADEPVTVCWKMEFISDSRGAPAITLNAGATDHYTYTKRAEVNDKPIDVEMYIDAREGKFDNNDARVNALPGGNGGQINDGAVLVVPAVPGMVVTLKASGKLDGNGTKTEYEAGEAVSTTFGSDNPLATDSKTVSYTYNGTDETLRIKIKNDGVGSYGFYEYMEVTYPALPDLILKNVIAGKLNREKPENAGTVTKTEPTRTNTGKRYVAGEEVTITAEAKYGYKITSITVGEQPLEMTETPASSGIYQATYTMPSTTATVNINYTRKTVFPVTIATADIKQGSVTISPVYENFVEEDNGVTTYYYTSGTSVKISSDPVLGYVVDHWTDESGTNIGSSNTLDKSITAAANFTVYYKEGCEGKVIFTLGEATGASDEAWTSKGWGAPIVPDPIEGRGFTIPTNYSMYWQSHNITGWKDASDNVYELGKTYSFPDENMVITLTPIYEIIKASFFNRVNAPVFMFDFRTDEKAQVVNYGPNIKGYWATHNYIKDIDNKEQWRDSEIRFDTGKNGKIDNTFMGDWAAFGEGTTLWIPCCPDGTITMVSYSPITSTTFNGYHPTLVEDESKPAEHYYVYRIEHIRTNDNYVPIVIGDDYSYYKYIRCDLPSSSNYYLHAVSDDEVMGAAEVNNKEAGIILKDGGVAYPSGTVVKVVAKRNFGYDFDYWADSEGNRLTTSDDNGCDDKDVSGYLTSVSADGRSNILRFKLASDITIVPHFKEKNTYYITYNTGKQATGVAPFPQWVEAGDKYVIPTNSTMYYEGYTLKYWVDEEYEKANTDVERNQHKYIAGQEYTAAAKDLLLYPVFELNEFSLMNLDEEATILWPLASNLGAPTINFEKSAGILVSQLRLSNGKYIDLKLDLDGNVYKNQDGKDVNGKFNNEADKARCQINQNSIITLPTTPGCEVTLTSTGNQIDDKICGKDGTKNEYEKKSEVTIEYTGDEASQQVVFGATGRYYTKFAVKYKQQTIDKPELTSVSYGGVGLTPEQLTTLKNNKEITLTVAPSLSDDAVPAVSATVNNGTFRVVQANVTTPVATIILTSEHGIISEAYSVKFEFSTPATAPQLVKMEFNGVVVENNQTINDAPVNGRLALYFDRTMATTSVEPTLNGVALGHDMTAEQGNPLIFDYWGAPVGAVVDVTAPAKTFKDIYGGVFNTPITLKINAAHTAMEYKKQTFDFVVGVDGDADKAIAAANASDVDRYYIFVPDGEYELTGNYNIYPAITSDNKYPADSTGVQREDLCKGQPLNNAVTSINRSKVSLIGQSQDKTILYNRPLIEGISYTSTIRIAENTTDAYLQDMTLDNRFPYNKSIGTQGSSGAARAVAFWDRGSKSILKNVTLDSWQDTYYSNHGHRGYFEDCRILGVVDFLCGGGDVWFERTDLVLRDRSGNNIAAPNTLKEHNWGYVFDNCKILAEEGADGTVNKTFTLGRPWANNDESPAVTFLNTKMSVFPKDAGWQKMGSGFVLRFHEYGSMDAEGHQISLGSRTLAACAPGPGSDDPILTDADAAKYTVTNVLGGGDAYNPQDHTAQRPAVSNFYVDDNILRWNHDDEALCYFVFKREDDGHYKYLTNITENYINLDPYGTGFYVVRAANQRGGLGAYTEPEEYKGLNSYDLTAKKISYSASDAATYGDYTWSTVCLPFSASVPAGSWNGTNVSEEDKIVVYAATEINDNAIRLQMVNYLADSVGYVVFAKADKTYRFRGSTHAPEYESILGGYAPEYVAIYEKDAQNRDVFKGYGPDTKSIERGNVNCYTLSYKNAFGIGFYKYEGATLAPYKAWLDSELVDAAGSSSSSSANSRLRFIFDDGESPWDIITDIDDADIIESGSANTDCYDLMGRRIDPAMMRKGNIYIIGGKKVKY